MTDDHPSATTTATTTRTTWTAACAMCQAPALFSVMEIKPLVSRAAKVRILCRVHTAAALPSPGQLISIRSLEDAS